MARRPPLLPPRTAYRGKENSPWSRTGLGEGEEGGVPMYL